MRRSMLVGLIVLTAIGCTPIGDGAAEPGPAPGNEPGGAAPDPAEPPRPTEFWIAPDGDDEGPGTEDHPWSTFTAALPQLQPGDTLHVEDGEYRERVREPPVTAATSDERIRVAAALGASPVVRGLFWLRDADYWQIEGLNVTWDDERNDRHEHMVKLSGGTGWEFTGAEVWGARSYAAILVADEPADWRLADLCVHDTHESNGTNQDHLIYVNNGLDGGDGLIERSLLFGAPNGSGVKLGGSSRNSGGAANVTVRATTIADAAQPVLIAWGSRNNIIEHSILTTAGRNYGAIRGYQLDGVGNVARGNVAFDVQTLLLNDEGYRGVQDGGDNRFPLDPMFDREDSCDGYQPREVQVAAAGHTMGRSS